MNPGIIAFVSIFVIGMPMGAFFAWIILHRNWEDHCHSALLEMSRRVHWGIKDLPEGAPCKILLIGRSSKLRIALVQINMHSGIEGVRDSQEEAFLRFHDDESFAPIEAAWRAAPNEVLSIRREGNEIRIIGS